MLLDFILFIATGALAGLLSGLLGIGGGVVVVPALVWIFHSLPAIPYNQVVHMAAGTSLAAMIVTATASVRAHARRGNVNWSVVKKFVPGMIIGVIIGASVAGMLGTNVLTIILGIVLILIALRIFFFSKVISHRSFPAFWVVFLASLFVGFKSGLLGLGGGVLTIPFLMYFGLEMRKASGSSAACTLPIAIVGTISFIIIGWHAQPIHWGSGYVYWPAFLGIAIGGVLFVPLGALLGAHLHTKWLKRIFAVFLLAVSIHLLV